MAKITRVVAKLFGSDAAGSEVGVFGSLAAGSPTTTTDPTVMQSLAGWLGGWYSAVVGGNSPAIEDMNAFCFVMAYQIAYLMQEGIAEWQADTTYYIGSLVNSSGTIYKSITDSNLNHAVTDASNWSTSGGYFLNTSSNNTQSAVYDIIRADATSGSFTQTLPIVSSWVGQKKIIKAIGSGANVVTVAVSGGTLIDGVSSISLQQTTNEFVTLYNNGTTIDIVG